MNYKALRWKKWGKILVLIAISIISLYFAKTYYANHLRIEGEKYARGQNFEKAIESFKRAIYLNPYLSDAYLALARTYIKLNRPSSAVDELLKASRFKPEDEKILNLLKKAYQIELTKSSPTLKIGIRPQVRPLTTIKLAQPLLSYFSRNLNQKISLTIIPEYISTVTFLTEGRVNIAIIEPQELMKIKDRPEIIPLGLISFYKRSIHQRIIILTREKFVQTVKDLKGRKIAFGEKGSLTGYILPRILLLRHGINPDEDLREVYFIKSQEEILTKVMEGKVDAGVLNERVFRYLSSVEQLSEKVHIVAYSIEVPANILVVRKDLSPKLIQRIKDLLIDYTRAFPDKLKFSPFSGDIFWEYTDFGTSEAESNGKKTYTVVFAEF